MLLAKSSILRIFFGIPIAEDKAEEYRKLLLQENPQLENQVRWTRPGNHHVTVHFLGNVAEQKVPQLIASIDEVIQDVQPFQMILSHITLFSVGHEHMITVNIRPSGELQSLYNTVNLVLAGSHFHRENRPYMPHITLLRSKRSIKFEKMPLDNQVIDVRELILYQSIPLEKGVLYFPLHTFPF